MAILSFGTHHVLQGLFQEGSMVMVSEIFEMGAFSLLAVAVVQFHLFMRTSLSLRKEPEATSDAG
ncbi:MAG: hypothetical protein ACE5HJ_06560 [Thermoplasmata archaeon]